MERPGGSARRIEPRAQLVEGLVCAGERCTQALDRAAESGVRFGRRLRRLVLEVARGALESLQVLLETPDHDDEQQRGEERDAGEGAKGREHDLAASDRRSALDVLARVAQRQVADGEV